VPIKSHRWSSNKVHPPERGSTRETLAPRETITGTLTIPEPLQGPEPVTKYIFRPQIISTISQAEPNKAFGAQDMGFIYSLGGEHDDIALQLAYKIEPAGSRDYVGGGKAYDVHQKQIHYFLDFLYTDTQSGPVDWLNSLKMECIFSIYGYANGSSLISAEDTWNNHPKVNFGDVIATVFVSITPHYYRHS
jgi:hypothetical protein